MRVPRARKDVLPPIGFKHQLLDGFSLWVTETPPKHRHDMHGVLRILGSLDLQEPVDGTYELDEFVHGFIARAWIDRCVMPHPLELIEDGVLGFLLPVIEEYVLEEGRVVLYGGRARGWFSQGDATEIAQRSAMLTLVRTGWGMDNPAFRRMFTSLFVPDATPEQMDWFDELQRRTISPENAARFQETSSRIDVMHLLGQVIAPTLVLHGMHDAVVPFEAGKEFAAGIRGARFVPLESKNHILLENEPAFARFLDEMRQFVNG